MVDDANPTPDADEDEPESPEELDAPDQAPETEPEPEADKPAAPPPTTSQAEFTRAQQAFAEAKVELGLPKTASRQDVLTALKALKGAKAGPPGEVIDPDEDPEKAELRRERDEARQAVILTQMESEREVSGELADDAFRFVNLARTSNDPREMVQAMREIVLKHRDAFAEELEPTAGAEDDEGTPEAEIGLSEGEGPTARPQPDAGRRNRETGAIGAVRGLFKAAAESSRR